MSGIDWFGDDDDAPPPAKAEPRNVADLYLLGKIRPCDMSQAIDDAVDAWHEGGSNVELHEFLGFTWEEYGRWVETNDAVAILDARSKPT